MSKVSRLVKMLGAAALVAGAFTFTAGSAHAQWHHHHHWRGGGVHFGFGAPYAYSPGPYYGCRYERVRLWRYGHWVWRGVRRCY